MQQIWAIASKDLKQLVRDKAGMFFVLVFPLLIAILFGSIFAQNSSNASKMEIGVDDQDKTADSKAFVAELKASSAVTVTEEPFVAGQELVRKGSQTAVIQVPKGFGSQSVFSGRQPHLRMAIDPSRKAEAGMLQGLVAQASFAPMKEMFSDPNRAKSQMAQSISQVRNSSMPAEEKSSLVAFLAQASQYLGSPHSGGSTSSAFDGPKIDEVSVSADQSGPKSAYEITFPQGIIWGLISVVMAFSIGTVRERLGGTYLRMRVAPISRGQFLAGKALACFLGAVGVIGVLLLVGALFFHVQFSSPALLALAIASASICFTGITMFLSVIGKTEAAASGGGRAVLILCSMFGGGMIPQFGMPAWMQSVSSITPVKWSILALEGSIWRGFSLTEMMTPCGILIGSGIVFFALGTWRLSRLKD